MTRPIKFRAWDSQLKSWIPSTHFSIGAHGIVYVADESEHGMEAPPNVVKLMQFTGLHDKNGKEIWEGDIISFKDGYVEGENGEYGDKTHTVSIAYDHHRFVAKRKDGTTWDNDQSYEDFRDDTFWEDCEVLGNIYENPELLEAK